MKVSILTKITRAINKFTTQKSAPLLKQVSNLVDRVVQRLKHPRSPLQEKNLVKIQNLEALPHYKQKSPEWLDQRSNYLTASTIAGAIGALGPVARETLMTDKVSYGKAKGFTGNVATRWGNKYEPAANAIYAYRTSAKIYDFGMVTNKKYPFLGVSPDGITLDNMLEIKCPYSRVIDGKIKKAYYHQMQEQMAVCEFDKCDFLECKFTEVREASFWEEFPENPMEKGIIIGYLNVSNNELEYLYSPIEYHTSAKKLKGWVNKTIRQLKPTQVYKYQTYWYLDEYHCQQVCRDPHWIEEYYPVLQKFWAEVEYYRNVGLDVLLKTIQKNRAEREAIKLAKRSNSI